MEKELIYNKAYTGDDTIPAFVTFCIEQYKHHNNISGKEAMRILSDAGVLDYLAEHYETLHLESTQWLLKDMANLVETKIFQKV